MTRAWTTLVAVLGRGDAFAWVAIAIIVLFAFVMVAALGLFFHHTRSHLRRLQLRRRMMLATDVLAGCVNEPAKLSAGIEEAVRRAGPRAAAAVLREFRLRVRGEFAQTLSRHLEELGEVDRLGKLSQSKRSWLRRAAARGLAECGGTRARAYLVWLLRDREPDVRRTARNGLLSREDPEGISAAIESYLQDIVVHRGWKASFYARLAIVAPEELRRMLATGRLEGLEEKLALEALGDVKLREEIPHIAALAIARLDADDPELRTTAVRVLGRLRWTEMIPRIMRDLKDPVWFVRAAAARALEQMGADPAIDDALATALTDREWWVRANAAKTLARRGDAGIERLTVALDSKDGYARDAALSALTSAGALSKLVGRLRTLAEANPNDAVVAGLLRRAEGARA